MEFYYLMDLFQIMILLAFFENDFGDGQCAGYVVWDGTTSSIAAQGDDLTTDEIDGLL